MGSVSPLCVATGLIPRRWCFKTREGRVPVSSTPHKLPRRRRAIRNASPRIAKRELGVGMLLGVRMVPAVRMVRGGVRMRLFAVFVDRLG
jgi:hypothetical protein